MASKKKREFNGEGKRLSDQVAKSMRKYFRELDGEKATNIYQLVLKEVEQPLCLLYTSPSPRDRG